MPFSSILDTTNLEKCGVNINKCAFLLDFLAIFFIIPHICPSFLEQTLQASFEIHFQVSKIIKVTPPLRSSFKSFDHLQRLICAYMQCLSVVPNPHIL